MTRLVIFDKDGTLTTTKSGEKFVQHPEDQVLLPGVAEGIAAMAADGWVMAIASNQGGVAAGHKTIGNAWFELRYCLKLLSAIGIDTSDIPAVCCPDMDGNELHMVLGRAMCRVDGYYGRHRGLFRKPSPGMIFALCDWGCILPAAGNVLFIGDHPEDEQAAANAGVAFQWADEWRSQYS